jgi:hypothetical protein
VPRPICTFSELICVSSWLIWLTSLVICPSAWVLRLRSVPATVFVESRKALRSSSVWVRGRLEAGSFADAVKSLKTVLSWLR